MTTKSKENLKWIVRYVVLAAIISYGLGAITNPTGKEFRLLSESEQEYVTEMISVYPEGIRAIVKGGSKPEFWQDVLFIFRNREKTNPTLLGNVILSIYGEIDENTSS